MKENHSIKKDLKQPGKTPEGICLHNLDGGRRGREEDVDILLEVNPALHGHQGNLHLNSISLFEIDSKFWDTKGSLVEQHHHPVHLGLVEANGFHLHNGHLSLLRLRHQYCSLDQQPTKLLDSF